jgi:hypothetical protein
MKEIVKDFSGNLSSMSSIPKWAQEAIVAGAYQQGKAEAMEKALNLVASKISIR